MGRQVAMSNRCVWSEKWHNDTNGTNSTNGTCKALTAAAYRLAEAERMKARRAERQMQLEKEEAQRQKAIAEMEKMKALEARRQMKKEKEEAQKQRAIAEKAKR